MDRKTIVVMEGDQTGQELLEESLRVLDPGVTGLDLEFQRRVRIHKAERLERSRDLRFFSQRVHAREGVVRLQRSTRQEQPAQNDAC